MSDTRNVRLTVAYDGTDFRGFAESDGVRTVMGELRRAVETIVRCPVEFAAAGRTDAGVHAFGQVAGVPTSLSLPVEKVTSVQAVEISILDVDMSAEVETFSYADTIQPKATIRIDAFSPRELMERLGATPPPTADPRALTRLALDARATMRESSVALTGMRIALDETTITGALTVPFESSGRFFATLEADAIEVEAEVLGAARIFSFGVGSRTRLGFSLGSLYLGLDPEDGVVRTSFVHYNTLEEIDRLIAVFDEVL